MATVCCGPSFISRPGSPAMLPGAVPGGGPSMMGPPHGKHKHTHTTKHGLQMCTHVWIRRLPFTNIPLKAFISGITWSIKQYKTKCLHQTLLGEENQQQKTRQALLNILNTHWAPQPPKCSLYNCSAYKHNFFQLQLKRISLSRCCRKHFPSNTLPVLIHFSFYVMKLKDEKNAWKTWGLDKMQFIIILFFTLLLTIETKTEWGISALVSQLKYGGI